MGVGGWGDVDYGRWVYGEEGWKHEESVHRWNVDHILMEGSSSYELGDGLQYMPRPKSPDVL
jgi:hypothetical protein